MDILAQPRDVIAASGLSSVEFHPMLKFLTTDYCNGLVLNEAWTSIWATVSQPRGRCAETLQGLLDTDLGGLGMGQALVIQ